MKTKLLLSTAFIFLLSLSAKSQDVTIVQSNSGSTTYASYSKPKKPVFWIGPKFGSEFVGIPSSIRSVPDRLEENWQAGVLMQMGRVLYVQPEAYYCMMNENLGMSNEITSTAIKVPVMLGLRFINLGLFSLHVMGGPQWTMPLAESEGTYFAKQMDWVVGAGIDVLGFITADVRYLYNPEVTLSDHINGFSFQTTPLNVTVGFKFR